MKCHLSPYLVTAVAALLVAPAALGASPLLKEFEDGFVRLAEEVRPCVVEITAENEDPDWRPPGLNDLFRQFIQPKPDDKRRPEDRFHSAATGSGFIYDKQGHIITNNHVVENAGKLTVELWNGDKYEATVVGTDPSADIAVIKIDAPKVDLPVARAGNCCRC